MKTTCPLRLLLILMGVLTFSPPVSAQTEPFEGLRFKEFNATIVRDWVSVHGMSNGNFISAYFNTTSKQVIEGGTNAFRQITLSGYWDGNTGGYSNLTPAVVVTNCFALGSNGVVGDLAADGLKPFLDGMGYTSYGAANPPNHEFQLPFQPFLGGGTVYRMDTGTNTGVSGELEIVLAGEAGSTNDVVVAFTVAATDEDTGLPIPDEDITLGGAVTNGVAWAKFADNSTNGATPDISGHSNWTASVTPTIYRAEIWVDEIAWFGSETNTTWSEECAPPAGGMILLVQTPMTNINDKTMPSVVGKKITLRAFPLSAESYLWTIGGSTVSNFVVDATSGGPVFDYPKTNQTVTFAWWKPGTNTITLTTKIGGKEMQRQCKFIVVDPPADLTTEVGNIALDASHPSSSGDSLHFGVGEPNPGVRFNSTGTPQTGHYQWVQIVNSSVSKLKKGGSRIKLTASGLDNQYPYSDGIPTEDSPLLQGYDDEGMNTEPLSGAYEEAEITDSYSMYLMYRPDAGGVWVPIQQVDWGWSARAVNGATGWGFPVAPTKNVPAATRANGWPAWTTNVSDATWEPD